MSKGEEFSTGITSILPEVASINALPKDQREYARVIIKEFVEKALNPSIFLTC